MFGLVVTFLISLILSLGIASIWGFNTFILSFLTVTVAQFFIFFLVRYFRQYYVSYLKKKLELEEIQTLNKFEYTISCASCHKDFNILLGLNENNAFKCPHCGQLNKVYFDIKNYIQLENIQDINYAQNAMYNKLQETISNGSK